jgi:alpha-beta hydrolase superfamily lysophospholipase
MEERLQHDLLPNAKKVTIPTLFIVGSEDTSCTAGHVQLLYEAIGSEDKELHIIDGAPHSYYEKSEQEECTETITDWLTKKR